MQKNAQRLRIYIDEGDRWRGQPLEAALLETLRSHGMAGATVFRGAAGFGAHSQIHTARLEVLSSDLPVVVEVVDSPEKIAAILETVYPMVREGLITREDVQIVKYTQRLLNPLPADRPVAEVMTREVVSLSAETTIHQAWHRMLENAVKAMPVVDAAGQVIGILTDQDLLERAGIQQRLSVAIRMDAAELDQELSQLENSALTVGAVMTSPAITAAEHEALGAAAARMVKAGLKRLPVVDSSGRLVGMLSRLDVLRQVADAPAAALEVQLPGGALKTLADIMRAELPLAQAEDDLAALVEKFARSASHRLIVVDESGRAVGLVSDSDVVARVQPAQRRGILEALRRIARPPTGRETARELMSPGPLTAAPDLTVVEAARRMLAESRKWIVVVDGDGKPLGLVDRQLLLKAVVLSDNI